MSQNQSSLLNCFKDLITAMGHYAVVAECVKIQSFFIILYYSFLLSLFLIFHFKQPLFGLKKWFLQSVSPFVTTGGFTGTQLDWKLHRTPNDITHLWTFTKLVDSENWLLILDSRAPKHKIEVMILSQVVHNRPQKMNMKK
jgi:hypothetical protein